MGRWTLLMLTCLLFQAYTCQATEDKEMTEKKNPVVLMTTTAGDIKIELFEDKAPLSVKNFLHYVKNGSYDHTIFHRVINGFMIQGGGFTKEMEQKPVIAPIKNEAENGLKNTRGTLAMARTSDVDSATAQFFINVADNSFLDFKAKNPREYGYCVFGKVIEGMDVVDKIKEVKTTTKSMHRDVPVDPIEIIKATVVS